MTQPAHCEPPGERVVQHKGELVLRRSNVNDGPRGRIASPDEFLLLRETNHRLANTFTVLAFALRRELGRSASAEVLASLDRCEARIVAFAKMHRALLVGGMTGEVSVRPYMETLCEALSEALLRPLGATSELFCEVDTLPSELCERLGLVVTELVTNAAKHAFGGNIVGLIRIALLREQGSLVCVVSDNGSPSRVSSSGAGSQIMHELISTLGGSMVVKSRESGTSVFVTCQPSACA